MCGILQEIAVIALFPECVVFYKEISVIALSTECVVFYKEIVVIALSPECVVVYKEIYNDGFNDNVISKIIISIKGLFPRGL